MIMILATRGVPRSDATKHTGQIASVTGNGEDGGGRTTESGQHAGTQKGGRGRVVWLDWRLACIRVKIDIRL